MTRAEVCYNYGNGRSPGRIGQGMQRNSTQQQSTTRKRSALGLVFVAALNLAFQPCSMAMETDTEHACPHCPPEMRHAGHHGKQDLAEVAGCDVAGAYSIDSRSDSPQAKKPLPDLHFLPVADLRFATRATPDADVYIATPDTRRSADPPLNVLYCVYLK